MAGRDVLAATTAGATVVAAVSLLVLAWRARAVIPGLCGSGAVGLGVAGGLSALRAGRAEEAIVGAAASVVVGTAVLGLGRLLERLLGDGAQDGP
jgi:hypothetical protein